MKFTIISGNVESNENLDGWLVTSESTTIEGAEDMPLKKGDRINLNGDVYRNNEFIGNVS